MKIQDYFDWIPIINLPSRPDRRREVVAELGRHGMGLKAGKIEFFDGIQMETDGGFPSVGLHGCYRSHLETLRKARDMGCSKVLVLEDDFQFCRKFAEPQDSLVAQLASRRWDLAYLGHSIPTEPAPTQTLTAIDPDRHCQLLHCYGVDAAIFDRLIAFMDAILTRPPGHPDCGPMSPDGAHCQFRARNPDVVALIATPNFCRQRSSRTDNHALRWFDRIYGVRNVASKARQVKTWIDSFS